MLQGSAEGLLFGNISTADFCERWDRIRPDLWPEDCQTDLIDRIAAIVLEWQSDRRISTTDDLRKWCRRVPKEIRFSRPKTPNE
jgi:hypothetical protein